MNHRPPFFRPEAMQTGDMGAPLGTRAVPWRALAAIVAMTVLLTFGFAAFAGVSRKETLSGYLRPAEGALRIVAPRGGTLSRVEVGPGQRVAEGARLFVIESSGSLESGGSLAEARSEALRRQIDALSSRFAAEQVRSGLDASQAQARLAGLRQEAHDLAEQRAVQAERVRVTEARLKAVAPLRAKGFISADELHTREEYLLSLRQGLSALDRQIAENRREQSDAAIEAREAPAALREQRAALQSELADLERRQTEVRAQDAQLVRAPIAGQVMALRARAGQPVAAGTPLLTLAPGSTRLQAVLFAKPEVIGLLKPGQRVRLMYDAFPVDRFGAHGGIVTRIAAAAVPSDESEGAVRYMVEVAPDRQGIVAYGSELPLQPDMTVKADIVLEERSLLEWILQPLLAARARR